VTDRDPGALVQPELEGGAGLARLHPLHRAHLHAAVGHLAPLEEPGGLREDDLHGEAPPEHPVDDAEVGGGDVHDADPAEDD